MENVQTAIQPQAGVKKIFGLARSDLGQMGNHLIEKFHALMRVSLMFDSKNPVLQPFLQGCLPLLNALVEKEGTLSLKVAKNGFYLNQIPLRYPMERYPVFQYVLTQLEKRRIGELVFKGPMDEGVLKEFIFTLVHLEEGRGENAVFFPQRWAGKGIASIEVIPQENFEEKREETSLGMASEKIDRSRAMAKKVFFEMIRMIKEIIPQIQKKEAPNLRMFKRLIQKVILLAEGDESTLLGLTTIKNYGGWTENHSVNVAIYALAIGRRLGFSRNTLRELATTALLHDIGKAKIPGEVLNKPASLDDGEWKLMRQHPRAGVEVILPLKPLTEFNPRMVIGIFDHHLKNDLSGYPKLFRKKKVSLFGRIIHIADVYDAMTASRIYRKIPYTPGQTVSIMVSEKGSHFDPILLKIFLGIVGIYPVGSVVLLDTSDLGIVMKPNPDPKLMDRPTVLLVSGGVKGEIVDLSEKDDTGHFRRSIAKALDPFQNHIDIARYFL